MSKEKKKKKHHFYEMIFTGINQYLFEIPDD